MFPAVNWRLSPFCLWIERRLSTERQRLLARRLVLALLVSALVALAFDLVTLPPTITTVWSRELDRQIVYASAVLGPRGEPRVVVVLRDLYPHDTYSTILLLDTKGQTVGLLEAQAPQEVSRLLFLPSAEEWSAVIGLPDEHSPGPSYFLKPNLSKIQLCVDPRGSDKTFSPSRLDVWRLGERDVLLVGFSPFGSPYITSQTYSPSDGQLTTLWVRKLNASSVYAHVMVSSGRKPIILAVESQDALVALDANGSVVARLNLTQLLIDRGMVEGGKAIRASIRGDQSAFGRRKAGIYVTCYQKGVTGQTSLRSFFVVVGPMLRVIAVWADPPEMTHPLFIPSESKLVTGDTCLGDGGKVAWIRRGFWSSLTAEADEDGLEEVISTGTAALSQRTKIRIFDTCGRTVATGSLPGRWGTLADASVEGLKNELLYYSGTRLSLIQISTGPPVLRALAEVVALVGIMALLVFASKGAWMLPRLRGFVQAVRIGFGRRATVQPGTRAESYARVVKHERYRLCTCGARNPLGANRCHGCGEELSSPQGEIDLSASGSLSQAGLVAGLLGLLVYWATPVVWSVEPSGRLGELVRALFAAISPEVPYPTWISAVAFLIGFVGICLIYLERPAVLGAFFCLLASGLSIYLSTSWAGFPLVFPILLGTCGLLQLVQKWVGQRGDLARRRGLGAPR